MTNEEFIARTNTNLSSADMNIVQTVYNFHPSIGEANGRDQITQLFKVGGMALMKDMLPRAKKAQELETQIVKLRCQLDDAKHELEILKNGNE